MKEAKTEFHSDTVRRSLLDRLVVLRPSWNTCKNMRIVTRRRLPGPIGRGGSESGGIHDFRVIEAGNRWKMQKMYFRWYVKIFTQLEVIFFFFYFFLACVYSIWKFEYSYRLRVRRGCRVKRKCKWVNGEVQVKKKKVRKWAIRRYMLYVRTYFTARTDTMTVNVDECPLPIFGQTTSNG